MADNYFTIFFTIINIVILIVVIIGIYKAIQRFKKFTNRNKDMDRKLDVILNKLEENKSDNNDSH